MATVLVLSALLALILFFLLALAQSGANPRRAPARVGLGRLPSLDARRLGDLVAGLFEERGYGTVSEQEERGAVDLLLERPDGVGQRLKVRCLPMSASPVSSVEVVQAVDFSRVAPSGVPVLVTTGVFSDDAEVAAQGVAELIDGEALARLVRRHLPESAKQLGLKEQPQRRRPWPTRAHA